MPLIVISGPEKAGKTTLINETIASLERGGEVTFARRWKKIRHHTDYLAPLIEDMERVADGEWVFWDRSWICEAVYSNILGRDGELGRDWWLGEWLYGRAVRTVGTEVVLLPEHIESLDRLRDETDLPIDPALEFAKYWEYAAKFRIPMLRNSYSLGGLRSNVREIAWMASQAAPTCGPMPPHYCGPVNAPVVVVGERRNERSREPGAWLPFTSGYTTTLGRVLGPQAMKVGWTNAEDLCSAPIHPRAAIVAAGKVAVKAVRDFGIHESRILEIPHPAYLYRWGKAKGLIGSTEKAFREFVLPRLA